MPSPSEAFLEETRWDPPRSSTAAWILYDLATTIFFFAVPGLYFATWLVLEQGYPDAALAGMTSATAVVVIVLSPWIGARSDHKGRRIPTLIVTTLSAVAMTTLLGTLAPLWSLVAVGMAIVALNIGSVVYDALLVDVSTPDNRGRISGLGVGVGYVGSLIALAIGTVLLDRFGFTYSYLFRSIAAVFLVFSLPALIFIKERPRQPLREEAPKLVAAMVQIYYSWRLAMKYPRVTRFLAGRFLYTDAINTVLAFLAIFLQTELGLSLTDSTVLLGVAIGAAVVGAFVGGAFVDRVGPARYLRFILMLWIASLTVGVAAPLAELPVLAWVLAPVGGFALGGTWTADRVVMARISPKEHLGEFYGLYATVGRFATFLGPLVWAFVAEGIGLGRVAALGSLTLFLIAALLVLWRLNDQPIKSAGDRPLPSS